MVDPSGKVAPPTGEVARIGIRVDPPLHPQVTQPSKSGKGQATMTVAVPQELNKHQVQTHDMRVLPAVNVNRGSIRVTRRNEGVLPPQSIPVKHDCVSLWRGGSV